MEAEPVVDRPESVVVVDEAMAALTVGGVRDQVRAVNFVEMGVMRIGNGSTSTKAICEGVGKSKEIY